MAWFLGNYTSVDVYHHFVSDQTYPQALAAMCIITSFVHLADFIFGLINMKKLSAGSHNGDVYASPYEEIP